LSRSALLLHIFASAQHLKSQVYMFLCFAIIYMQNQAARLRPIATKNHAARRTIRLIDVWMAEDLVNISILVCDVVAVVFGSRPKH